MISTMQLAVRRPAMHDTVRRALLSAKGKARQLAAFDHGQVAVLMALTVLPIAIISGFAIDFQMLTTR